MKQENIERLKAIVLELEKIIEQEEGTGTEGHISLTPPESVVRNKSKLLNEDE